MKYIIGRKSVYELGISKYGDKYTKLGRKSAEAKGITIFGGIVFDSLEQAKAYIICYQQELTHDVYGVEATEKDLVKCKFGPWYQLENSCKIVKLNTTTEEPESTE